MKIIGVILLTFILALMALPVFAISTATTVVINSVTAYENCIEAGDLMITVDYTITMSPAPSELTSATFILRFTDSTGVSIKDNVPYAYYNRGYAEGFGVIYFTADEVGSDLTDLATVWAAMAAGANYYIRLDGNPSATWTGGGSIPQAGQVASNSFVFKTSASTAITVIMINQDVLSKATILQTDWNDTDYILIGTQIGSAYGYVLTTQGSNYFGAILPDVTSLITNILPSRLEPITPIDPTGTSAAAASSIADDFTGTPLDLSDSASALHVGAMWLGIIITLSIDGFVIVQSAQHIGSYKFVILVSIPLLYLFTRIGWFPMLLTIGLGLLSALVTWYVFFYEKQSA